MKKFLFFVVFVFVCVVANAQTFVPVKSYVKGRALMAYGVDGSYVSITAAQYLALKDNGVGDYKIVSYKGKDAESSFSGVISNKEYTSELLQVNSTSIVENGIKVLLLRGQAFKNGELLDLTAAEYKLLCLLSKNVGKVLTHTYITQQIWGSSWENDIASLRVFMATLRKKLERGKDGQQYIQTHIGIGYRMLRVE